MAASAATPRQPAPPPPPPPPHRPPHPRPWRELVLLGGGHAHVEVLRRLPSFDPRVRVTLVARETPAPYSGMLPGVVSGAYAAREAQIDLLALAARGGAGRCRVVRGAASAVDVPGRRVLVQGEGWLPYDLLSINVGIEPAAAAEAEAEAEAEAGDELPGGGGGGLITPVKPIGGFLERWEGEMLPLARRALEARAEEEAAKEEGEKKKEGGDDDDRVRRRSSSSSSGGGGGGPAPSSSSSSSAPFRIAVVGGGAGGIELAFAVAQRLEREWARAWRQRQQRQPSSSSSSSPPRAPPGSVTLFSRGRILQGAPPAARAAFLRMADASLVPIRIREHVAVVPSAAGRAGAAAATAGSSLLRLQRLGGGKDEEEEEEEEEQQALFDACLWCTQAAAPAWFARAPSRGLPLDARGFLRTRPTLQLSSSSAAADEDASAAAKEALDDVFAAGDAASIDGAPRPKAGVYAVRAGPVLAENLRRRAQWLADAASSSPPSQRPPPPPPRLVEFRPQARALALISAGAGWALALRPPLPLCPGGAWAWALKDRIDRAFVARFDPLAARGAVASAAAEDDAAARAKGGDADGGAP